MRYVLSPKNQNQGLPIIITVLSWLVLDRLHAASWIYGVAGTILAILWVTAIVTLFQTELVDITTFLKEQQARNQIKKIAANK